MELVSRVWVHDSPSEWPVSLPALRHSTDLTPGVDDEGSASESTEEGTMEHCLAVSATCNIYEEIEAENTDHIPIV